HPYANAGQLVLSYTGADSLQLDGDGNLIIQTPSGDLLQTAPVSFQQIDGEFRSVESRYVLEGDGQVRIDLGAFDPAYALLVDPTVQPGPPIAHDDGYTVAHDRTLSVAAPGVLGNDQFRGGPQFTAALVNGTSHGSLSLSSNGSFTYTPSYHY